MVVLVNVLTKANLRINHIERESNYVKFTKFKEIKVEDPNKWLEQYNKIIKTNK